MRSPGVRCSTFIRFSQVYPYALPLEGGLFCLLPGYPAIETYYLISVRPNLTLPSASFSHTLASITLPRLVDRFKSAYRGLAPPSSTPCPAHNQPHKACLSSLMTCSILMPRFLFVIMRILSLILCRDVGAIVMEPSGNSRKPRNLRLFTLSTALLVLLTLSLRCFSIKLVTDRMVRCAACCDLT